MKRFLKLFLVLLFVAGCARTISDLILKVGDGTDADVKIEMELGKGASNPYLNYDTTNDKFQFCNEGSACEDMGSGSGGGVPLLGKGSLLTSDGVTNGEFTACADDEIIVYDSAETNGFKCEAKPTGGGSGPTVYQFKRPSTINSTTTSVAVIPSMTFTVTTTGGPVYISCSSCSSVSNTSSYEERYLYRDGTLLTSAGSPGTGSSHTLIYVDTPAAGTYTYSARWRSFGATMFNPTNSVFTVMVY